MNLKYIFWPWGVIGDLETDVRCLQAKNEKIEEAFKALDDEFYVILITLIDTARDMGIASVALIDIIEAANAASVSSATINKLRDIAETANSRLLTVMDDNKIEIVRRNIEFEDADKAASR